ncbi:Sulfoquinovosyl transferase sqd2 [Thalictrum thalictroides]|uniref:Sulfoquinovosyl transferase sqd2 n=1 Tax=Thalictrum thalictroides TaxID=46969 RepID=A0A7J6WL10_THATH|nr:Sulfoquinovosyl transferase sqd2 [Thalictrum thalictroides]
MGEISFEAVAGLAADGRQIVARPMSEATNYQSEKDDDQSSDDLEVFDALLIAKLLCVPIVMSYHTHDPIYIPRYTFSWLVKPMWMVIQFLHRAADLTLVPSVAIGRELEAARVTAGAHTHPISITLLLLYVQFILKKKL